MIKVYGKTGELLNIIYSVGDLKSFGREDITDKDQYLQCAIMNGERDKTYKAHKHITKSGAGEIHVQEAFILITGKAKVRIFDLDDSIMGDYQLITGDLTVLLNGGHSLELEADCILYEIKTGPYEGQEKDKIFI